MILEVIWCQGEDTQVEIYFHLYYITLHHLSCKVPSVIPAWYSLAIVRRAFWLRIDPYLFWARHWYDPSSDLSARLLSTSEIKREPLERRYTRSFSITLTPFFSHLTSMGASPCAWQSKITASFRMTVTSWGSLMKNNSLKHKTPAEKEGKTKEVIRMGPSVRAQKQGTVRSPINILKHLHRSGLKRFKRQGLKRSVCFSL